MTLKNTNIIDEMDKIFERMHARLNQRFRQLIQQVNSQKISMIHSCKKSKFNSKIKHKTTIELCLISDDDTTIFFCPINEIQLEQSIDNFGCLTVSTSFNDLQRCESVCMLSAFNHSFLLSLSLFFPILHSD
jgi:hypothetical protein